MPTGATRETGATVETVAAGVRGARYVDTDVQPGSAYTYQVAAVVDGGEAARSARVTAAVPCAYAVTPPHRDVLWAAGGGQVAVTTGPGCAWTAASESAFLAVAGGAAGTGPGTVRYTVAANAGGPRTGALVGGGPAGDGLPGVADGVHGPSHRARGDAGQGDPLPGAAGADRRATGGGGPPGFPVDGPGADAGSNVGSGACT